MRDARDGKKEEGGLSGKAEGIARGRWTGDVGDYRVRAGEGKGSGRGVVSGMVSGSGSGSD